MERIFNKRFFIVFVSILIGGALPFMAYALSLSSLKSRYFGGKVTQVTYCTCYYDPAVILEIDDVVTKETISLKYSLFYSKLYQYYNVFKTGVRVVGSYSPGDGTCRQTEGYTCSEGDSEAEGVINRSPGVGTSLK